LPVKRRICPLAAASPIFSIAAMTSSIVAFVMSTPSASMTSAAESRHSLRNVTRPLNFGSKRSLASWSLPPVSFGL
jgi:hypothetical protein